MTSNYSLVGDRLRFKILAPVSSEEACVLPRPAINRRLHEELLFGIQLVRGAALRECGQISTQLTPDGRHVQEADKHSWHIILQNEHDRILGCARYQPVNGGFEQLGASRSALAHSRRYGPILRTALEKLIAKSCRRNMQYGEVGGWALRPEIRGTTAAVTIALLTQALAEQLGSGLVIATATRTNHSAMILKRIGGKGVPGLPAYYEPKYGSIIEIVHSELPHVEPRYASRLERVRAMLAEAPVIMNNDPSAPVDPRYRLPHLALYGRPEAKEITTH